jgi:isoquinoline 1-oxidoreductase
VVCLVEPGQAQDARGRRGGGRGAPQDIGAWLHISETGEVTVFTGKVEVGQNIRTSLTQVVAEELPVPITSIRFVMADTQLTPYDAGTFGSRTTPDMSRQLRRVAAAAREWLLDLAAEHWQTDRGSLAAREGQIERTPGPTSISFGNSPRAKSSPGLLPTIPPSSPRPIGRSPGTRCGRSMAAIWSRAVINTLPT